MKCIIHIDGGARGNPGPAAAGVVIRDADSGRYLLEAGYYLGETTNNVAEYEGLIRSLRAAHELGVTRAVIHSDSELMVKQVNGEYRVKAAHLKPKHAEATELLSSFDAWEFVHVRREKNKLADELANRAMDAGDDVLFETND